MNNFEAGYAAPLGSTTAIPPYRNFFAGGAESVRGYKASTLGPKDTFGNPYGGNIKLTNQFELLLPMPEKFKGSARASLFFDARLRVFDRRREVLRPGQRHAGGIRLQF